MSNQDTFGADKELNRLTFQTRQFDRQNILGGYDKVSAALAGGAVKDAIKGGEDFKPSRESSTVEIAATGAVIAAPGGFQITVAEPNEADPKYDDVQDLIEETSANRDAYRDNWDSVGNHHFEPVAESS